MSTANVRTASRVFWLASLMFFASGSTGLAYQVIWFKRFAHVWGSSSLAFAAVGGSFLFGLGLGAYLLGRVADRVKYPLLWYGASEFLIGVLALAIPFEIQWLVDASVGLYAQIPDAPLARFLAQFAITLIVIGPPCVLMGGTLPLLIRQLTAREGALDQATGWLYAINTFGAAAGCYVTGFHLLPAVGLLWTNNLAAALNIAIGISAVLVLPITKVAVPPRPPQGAKTQHGAETKTSGLSLSFLGVYVAVTFSGLSALMLEMTWTRQLALVLGGSAYAYTSTLFVVLVGIALGSLIFHLYLRDYATAPWLRVVVIGVLLVTVLLGKLLLPGLSRWVGGMQALRGDVVTNALLCVGASSVLEFIPALAMGILFPLFVDLTRQSAAAVGRTVGDIYAWNTLGSIVGASLTAVILFPLIGTAGAVALAAALYVLALLAILPVGHPMLRVATAAGGALVVGWLALPIDPSLTNFGMYMYGNLANKQHEAQPVYFREGPSSNVFVTQQGSGKQLAISLRVNGKVDASNGFDMLTQLGLAYFPRIFNHDARDILVIGFGSGTTSGTSLLFPGTRVTCCEIEPAVPDASDCFASVNHRPQDKLLSHLVEKNNQLPESQRLTDEQLAAEARFNIVFGDGRTTLQGSDKKYDLIISEPSNPWLAGVSNLFTREFFKAARAHLNAGGVLAQWIQTYNFTLQDYLMIVRTLRTEFPHCGLISLANGSDTVLLASMSPLIPAPRDLDELQKTVNATPEIVEDLKKWYGTSDLRMLLLLHYVVDEDSLARLIDNERSKEINTDLNLHLEFDAPLHLFRKLSAAHSATIALQEAANSNTAWQERIGRAMGIDVHSAQYQVALAANHRTRGDLDRALTCYQNALAIQPDLADAYYGVVAIRQSQNKHPEAIGVLRDLLKVQPRSADAHATLAQELLQAKQEPEAVRHFREALRLRPRLSAEEKNLIWANNLAWVLATHRDPKLRNGEEAVRWAKGVCEAVGYSQTEFMDTLAAAYAEAGQFDEAVKCTQQLIAKAETTRQTATIQQYRMQLDKMLQDARSRLRLYQASQPYREG